MTNPPPPYTPQTPSVKLEGEGKFEEVKPEGLVKSESEDCDNISVGSSVKMEQVKWEDEKVHVTDHTAVSAPHESINIDIENIGNLESIFVMLHKDAEEESENIDVNNFLANL